MPIYVYRCDCGHRFERLVPRDADPPVCPRCGGDTRKIPAGPQLAGRSRADSGTDRVPIPWRGVQRGGAEKIQREVEFRQRLEAKGIRETDGPRQAGSGGSAPPPAAAAD